MRTLAALVVLLCVLFAVASAHNINKKSLRCAACGFFVNQITTRTAGLSNPAEIRNAVNGVCATIPNEHFQSKCTRFIGKHGDAIVGKLVKGESLEGFCRCAAKMPVEVSTKYCAICQFLVAELENATRNNEPAVIKVLERACNVLPTSYRTTCEAIIETFGPMLIEKFLEMETPDKVCHQVHLCSSSNKNVVPEVKATTPAQSGLECEFCKFVLAYVEQQLAEPKNQEAVERALQNVCKIVPKQMQSSCESLIKIYYPVLVTYILEDLPPEVICQKVKLCSNTKLMGTPAVSTPATNELECVVCKYLMKVLENFITGNETADELQKLFHKACTYLPHTLEGQCNSLVDAFGPQLAQWIIQNGVKQLDQFCTSVGLCKKNAAEAPIVDSSSLKCPICEYVVSFLEERLQSDVTQQRIEKLLEEVCHHLPNSMQSTCTALIDAYTPVIINWFLNKEPPHKLCAQIKLCSSAQLVQTGTPKAGQYCAICMFVMEFIEDYIAKDATEAKIIAAVEKVCDVFPKSISPTCKAFIQANGAKIIEALLNKENPQVVCQQIKACTSKVVDEPADASFMCPACEFVMAQLEQFLQQNRTQQEIQDFLNRVCDLIPGDLKSMCHVLIDLELPNIINWLQSIPPSKICAAIGACKRQALPVFNARVDNLIGA